MCEGGTVTHLALKDELLDAQLLRTVGTAPYGGADVGECLSGPMCVFRGFRP